MTSSVNERELILDMLIEILEEGRYSHIVLREVLDKYQFIDKKKRAFITRITEGTVERLIEIDFIINQFSKVKVKKMKPVIRNIIRSAVYQMKYMDSVPNSAVCNEAVKLATKRKFHGLKGFVNGVTRNISRNIETISYPNKEDGLLYYSIKYSMPEWIVAHFMEQYGGEIFEKMAASSLEDKGTSIRVNTSKISKEALVESLESEGVLVEDHPYLPYALVIRKYDNLSYLDSFQEGYFQVQDISSMLVSHLANPKEGDYIIDVCAAPGGKALHMADLLHGTGMVEARDLTEYKVNLIQDNIERTGNMNIKACQADATVLDESSIEKADIVIADLPCSGLGVLGKKTDLKYKVTKESLVELQNLQRQILKNAIQYVKKGGKLVYSTCTVNPLENQDNSRWIRQELGCKPIDFTENLCQELKSEVSQDGELQLLQGVHKCDGFFISVFEK